MTTYKWLGAAALAAALALGAAPAYAQHNRGQRGGESRAQAAPGHPAERSAGPRAVPRGSYEGQRAVPRSSVPYTYSRRYDNGWYGGRSYGPSYYGRSYYGRPYYGGYYGYGYRGYGYGYREYYGRGYLVPVVPYYRPYYAFRPRFTIGFGLFVGYPIPYPYYYGYPSYVYGAPYPVDPYYSGYPYSATVVPHQGTYGGISFEISPDDAAIYIDGNYVGVVRDFSPTHQPLTVTPGVHRIELQAQGCQPLGFDVTIMANQVIPYRGALQPY